MNVEPDGLAPAAADSELSIIETVRKRQMQDRQRVWHPDKVRPSSDLLVACDSRHARIEAIRALRTKLLLARDRSTQSGTITVLSACSAEGRSQLCAELAISFAQLGRQTLLVDADLRSPRQHLLFGAHNQWGLAQTLCQGEPPRVYGVQGIPHLALLTSGAATMNPLELLSGDRFEHLIGAWQHEYEFVVIDTPPVTQYADGLAIASVARRVLIVCRSPVTSFKDVKEMTRHLAAAPTQVIGAVINQF
jgi:protein-tyrosine kinase